MSRTVYEQLGGFVVVRKIVTEFYNNVLDNEELATFFSTTDMERLIDHQTKFISMLLGGPVSYTEEQLQERADKMKAQAARSDDIWLKRIWLDKASDLMREVARSKGA